MVNHYNFAKYYITNSKSKLELAQLNLDAGRQVSKSGAFELALGYFLAGINFLEEDSWQTHYKLSYDLYYELININFLTSNFLEADKLFNYVLELTHNSLDKAKLYSVMLSVYYCQTKNKETIEAALVGLSYLGIKLPHQPNLNDIEKLNNKIKKMLGGCKISDLAKHKTLTNPKIILAQEIIQKSYMSSHIYDQKIHAMLSLQLLLLTLKFGNSIYSGFAYLYYAKYLVNSFPQSKNIEHLARDFSKLGYELSARINDKFLKSELLFSHAFFTQHRYFPMHEVLKTFKLSGEMAIEAGSLSIANLASHQLYITSLYLGRPINELREICKEAFYYAKKNGELDRTLAVLFGEYLADMLSGKLNINQLHEQVYEGQSISEYVNNPKLIRTVFLNDLYPAFIYYLFGDAKKALPHLQVLEKMMADSKLKCVIYWPLHVFLYPLTISQILSKNSVKNSKYLQVFKQYLQYLKEFAVINPDTFKNKYLLVQAEWSKLNNQNSKALNYYLQSIETAKQHKLIHEEAIASELLARFYLQQHDEVAGNAYLEAAYRKFDLWGAKAKLNKLENEFPFLEHTKIKSLKLVSTRHSGNSSKSINENFDLMSILKASQSISSEIHLEVLLKQLLNIMIENSGANRAILLRKGSQTWSIEAEGKLDNGIVNTNLQQISLEDYDAIPHSILNYMKNKKEIQIFDLDFSNPKFLMDPYIKKFKPKSLMALPIFYQNTLQFIIYLENNLLDGVFIPERLQTLKLLASQAAVSLENARLYARATHDPLTSLANRNLLYEHFDQAVSRMNRVKKQIAVIFCDLDHFKVINDTLGHEIGDKLLIYYADQIRHCLRAGFDLGVRLGGDEFVIVLENINSNADIKNVVDRFYERLSKPTTMDDVTLSLSSSMGISIYPQDGDNIHALLKKADLALYQSKECGRNQYQFYSQHINDTLQQVYFLERELQLAYERKEFCLYYQPIFNTQNKSIQSLEVLLRWNHPVLGIMAAAEFIKQLEKMAIMLPLEEWIIDTACKQIKLWQKQDVPIVPLMINISASQLKKRSLSLMTKKLLRENNVDPQYVVYEISELTLLDKNDSDLINEFHALKELGVSLALDDFCTAYSSLSYLQLLPISILKIDREFVKDSQHQGVNRAIIECIIMLSHQLNFKTVAEGVETTEQMTFLEQMNIDAIQGYYFGYPLSAEDCGKLLITSII